ncbi:MAG TPA: hypothetical protein VMP89_02800 [Solirubrobacteraceae bacterium]|nr:hypothetical protein [Solirubrobacteraceae bacterium]
MASRAVNTRDAGLALISRINRWMIAGAVAFSGVISLVAARSFHGHTVSAVSQPAQSSSAGSGSSSSGSSSSGSGLSQPSQAPAPAPAQSAPAPVVSGGS